MLDGIIVLAGGAQTKIKERGENDLICPQMREALCKWFEMPL